MVYFQTPRFLAAKMKKIGQIRCFCLGTGAFHPIPDGKMTNPHPPLTETQKTHLWCKVFSCIFIQKTFSGIVRDIERMLKFALDIRMTTLSLKYQ